jgi:hypothetical protein
VTGYAEKRAHFNDMWSCDQIRSSFGQEVARRPILPNSQQSALYCQRE